MRTGKTGFAHAPRARDVRPAARASISKREPHPNRSSAVRVDFGQTKFPNKKTNQRAPVVLDLDRTINGHILIAGASGTGKTHQIRRILREMRDRKSVV